MSDTFVKEVLEATNKYRVRHHVPPLVLNKDISKISQAWANNLVKIGEMSHNPKAVYKSENLGENVALHFNSNKTIVYTGDHPVEQWYCEIEDYDFDTHTGPNTGHFTQLIWKKSKELGVARAQGSDGTWMTVCNYYPSGNFVGEYKKNVIPSSMTDTLRSSGKLLERKKSRARTIRTETVIKTKNGVKTTTTTDYIVNADGTKQTVVKSTTEDV